MPDIDGYEVYKTIRSINSLNTTQFIFLTAKSTPEDFTKGLSLGADDYITKPFTAEELINSINLRLKKVETLNQLKKDVFNFIIENPLLGVLVYQDNKFIYANNKALDILKYSLDELNTTKPTKIFIDPNINFEKIFFELDNNLKKEGFYLVPTVTKENILIVLEAYVKIFQFEQKQALLITFTKKVDPHLEIIQNTINKIQDLFEKYEQTQLIDQINEIIKNDLKEKKFKKEKIKITEREKEVLELICKGYSTKEIAEKLNISYKTVENHRVALLEKFKAKNVAELVAIAVQNNFVNL